MQWIIYTDEVFFLFFSGWFYSVCCHYIEGSYNFQIKVLLFFVVICTWNLLSYSNHNTSIFEICKLYPHFFISKMSILNIRFNLIYTVRAPITFIRVNKFSHILLNYFWFSSAQGIYILKQRKEHSAHIATNLFRWNKIGWHDSQAAGMVWQLIYIDRQWKGTLNRGAALFCCILQLKLLRQKEIISTSTFLILGYLSALS